MERVDVYRGATEMGANGNPTRGEMRHIVMLIGFVEPVETLQSPGADSRGVARRFALYFRGEPTGVLDTDCLVVRDRPLVVNGSSLEWWRHGLHISDVVNASVREG